MISWFLRRLGQILPTLLILSFGIFALQQLMPGDPALILAGEERGDPAVLAQIRAELMLDRPLLEQYGHWLWRLLHGDFGFSWRIRVPVGELLLDKLPVTAQLASMSFVIGVAIGVPAGVISAVAKDKPLDWLMNAVALFGISMPNFWLGIMMILLFSVQLGWLPPSGYVPLWEDPWQSLATTIMPAFVLGTGVASVLMRHTRAAMLGALEQDYIRTARAKGVPWRRVVWVHGLRNASIPIVTVVGLYVGILLGNSVLTEIVFNRPGLGKIIVGALNQRDYTMLQGLMVIYCFLIVVVNLVTDLLYGILDPRVKQA